MTKPFYKSKTLWFNALAALIFVANALGYADFMPDAEWMALVMALLNLALRVITRQPLALGAARR